MIHVYHTVEEFKCILIYFVSEWDASAKDLERESRLAQNGFYDENYICNYNNKILENITMFCIHLVFNYHKGAYSSRNWAPSYKDIRQCCPCFTPHPPTPSDVSV